MAQIPRVFGTVARGFGPMRKAFVENFQRGEVGASLCVFYRGQLVVDLWGGFADKGDHAKEWQRGTLANVYSCSKGVANTCLLKLVDGGFLNLDAPVARYWPEFAANGKAEVTVSQLVSHQGGVPFFDSPVTLPLIAQAQGINLETNGSLTDADNTAAAKSSLSQILSNTTPKWPLKPSSTFGYHPLSIGLFVSELVRRVDKKGRSLREFFNQEIAAPLGLDFHFGLPSSLENRAARLYQISAEASRQITSAVDSSSEVPLPSSAASGLPSVHRHGSSAPRVLKRRPGTDIMKALADSKSISFQAFTAVKQWSPWKSRMLEIPSAVGFSNAHALARMYSELSLAAVGESKFLKQETMRAAIAPAVRGKDLVTLEEAAFSRAGFVLMDDFATAFSHAGNGGALGLGDAHYSVGFGYVTNSLSANGMDSPRRVALVDALYACLFELHSTSANDSALRSKL